MKSSFDRVSLIHHRSSITAGRSSASEVCTVPDSHADKRLQGFLRPLTREVCEEQLEKIDSTNLSTGSDQGQPDRERLDALCGPVNCRLQPACA